MTVFTDGEGFIYEPNRSYRGSARVDEEGNFRFHPYRSAEENPQCMQHRAGGQLAKNKNLQWDIYRNDQTLKVTLTVRSFRSYTPATLCSMLFNLYYRAASAVYDHIR